MCANSAICSWLWIMPKKAGPAKTPVTKNMMTKGWRNFCPTMPVTVAMPKIAAISKKELSFVTSVLVSYDRGYLQGSFRIVFCCCLCNLIRGIYSF